MKNDAGADYLIDIGPGAGAWGEVVAAGDLQTITRCPRSLTSAYLWATPDPVPAIRRPGNGKFLTIRREHNLKNIDVSIPLGCFVVTGFRAPVKTPDQ